MFRKEKEKEKEKEKKERVLEKESSQASFCILNSANNSQLLQFVTSRLPITKYCNNNQCSVYSSGLLRKLVHSSFPPPPPQFRFWAFQERFRVRQTFICEHLFVYQLLARRYEPCNAPILLGKTFFDYLLKEILFARLRACFGGRERLMNGEALL